MVFRLFILLLLGLAACAPVGGLREVPVECQGKVFLDGQGHGGVVVSAWPVTAVSLGMPAPYRSAPSGADGGFTLTLPAGEYYLLAEGGGTFAYYGRNPVALPAGSREELRIGLVRSAATPLSSVAVSESGVEGRVTVHGQPRADVVIFAYTDLSSRLKGMGYAMSVPSDQDGRFSLPLPAGTYYLLARLRQQGGMVTGPLRAGDFIGYAEQNPVQVANDRMVELSIPLLEVPEKVDRLADSLFGGTSLKGRIVTRDGRPVSGARAILYNEAQMLNRPLYVSQPSDEDGRFVISFPLGGTYYLAARQQLGGAPAPGELYGTYDATPDHSLTVTTGDHRDGLELVVEEMW